MKIYMLKNRKTPPPSIKAAVVRTSYKRSQTLSFSESDPEKAVQAENGLAMTPAGLLLGLLFVVLGIAYEETEAAIKWLQFWKR